MPFAPIAFATSVIVAGAAYVAPATGLVSVTSGGVAQLRIARSAFNRPLVWTLPETEGITSTALRIADLSCVVFREQPERTSAAAPATCGVAIDVPLRDPYRPPGHVDTIATPGAARSTDIG